MEAVTAFQIRTIGLDCIVLFVTGATGSGSSSGKGSDDGKGAGPPVFLCPNCGDTTPLEQFLSKLFTLF